MPSCPTMYLAGYREVLEAAGVTKRTLNAWREQPGFPKPIAVLAATPIWDMRAVRAWLAAHGRDVG